MLRYVLLTLAMIGATACASAPAADATGATVQFEKGYVGGHSLGDVADQQYLVLESDGLSFRRAALFNFLNGDRPRAQRLPAGQRLTIHAITSYAHVRIDLLPPPVSTEPPATREQAQCNGLARFTPEAGHSYTVVQAEVSHGACEMRVVDMATGAPPGDLEVDDDVSDNNGPEGQPH